MGFFTTILVALRMKAGKIPVSGIFQPRYRAQLDTTATHRGRIGVETTHRARLETVTTHRVRVDV